jgi:hypothetical protein
MFHILARANLPLNRSFSKARNLGILSPLPGVLQNDAPPMIIDDPPFFDLLQGSKAAQTSVIIV